MPAVAPRVYAELGTKIGRSEADYFSAIKDHPEPEKLPIFSDDGASIASKALQANACRGVLSLAASTVSDEWKYAKIEVGSTLVAEVLFCPPDGVRNKNLPPTLGEQLLLEAWLSGSPSHEADYASSVLAVLHNSSISHSTVTALLTTLDCHVPVNLTLPRFSFINGKLAANLDENSRFIKKQNTYSRLLEGALREREPRWRFLQMYRMLEQGYLEIIFDGISSDFFIDPGQALKSAEKAVSSELEQLKRLVKDGHLQEYFEFMYDDLQSLDAAGNRFAKRVNTKASSKSANTKYELGAAAIYVIRCAIAHAGVRDLYYEQFPDADTAVVSILSVFEEAVLGFIGIKLTA